MNILQFLILKFERLKFLLNYSEPEFLESSDNRITTSGHYAMSNVSKGMQENKVLENSTKSVKLPIIASITILIIFVTILVVTDLLEFYYRLGLYNVDAFDKSKSREYHNVSLIVSEYLSNPLFAIFTFVSIGSSFLFMLIKSKPIPFFIALYVLLLSVVAGIGFIYPHRTLPFVITLFVPAVAYMVHRVAVSAAAPSNRKAKSKRKARTIYYTVVSAFVLASLGIQAPSVYNQLTSTHGWFLSESEGFEDMYRTSTWIKNNIDPNDLILNDRSYSSLFIHGFAIKNLTYQLFEWLWIFQFSRTREYVPRIR